MWCLCGGHTKSVVKGYCAVVEVHIAQYEGSEPGLDEDLEQIQHGCPSVSQPLTRHKVMGGGAGAGPRQHRVQVRGRLWTRCQIITLTLHGQFRDA